MVANIEGLAGFTKRNRRSCEIFYARRDKTLAPSLFYPCLRIKKVQAKGQNVDALQAKFDGIVR